MVRVTAGYEIDPVSGKHKQKTEILGYAATRAEGMQMLASYNMNPFDIKASKITLRRKISFSVLPYGQVENRHFLYLKSG